MFWTICCYYEHISSEVNKSIYPDILYTLGVPIILIVVLYVIYRFKNIRKYVLANIKTVALLIFISGVILYCIGFNEKGSELNFAALAFRSVLSSMEMFVSHSDLIEVGEDLHESPIYMTLFSSVHFLAVLISAVFVLRILGIRFLSWCRMYKDRIHPSGRKDSLYIFWGINGTSLLLAKSIADHENEHNPQKKNNYRIIFVEVPSKENHHERLSFSHFFSSFSHYDKKLERIENLDALITYSGAKLFATETDANLLISVGLTSLNKLIMRAKNLKFFFLSEDENENVKSVLIMQNYISWLYRHDENKSVHLYCHARRTNANRMLESLSISGSDSASEVNYSKVDVIDSSFLSVLSLKMNADYHPVSFVDTTPSGVVTTPFTSLIIGFGETGQDALGFLYEFGAFVGEDGNKSPFKCYAIDPEMHRLQGDFYMKVPALKDNNEIELLECSNEMPFFWDKLNSIISTLNYVVIATGNDKKNISLAIDLYEFACRYRGNELKRFKIFVRSYNAENYVQLKKVADYYNKNNRDSAGEIIIFGATEELFTYNMVIDDVTKENAKRFYYEYEKSRKSILEATPDQQWKARRRGIEKGVSNHRELLLKELQDMSNSWHIETKVRLASKYSIDEMLKCTEGRDKDSTVYPNADEEQNVLLTNLAKCEHLRWKASNEMEGYVTYEIKENEDKKKDYIAKKLSCLVSCDRLEQVPSLKDTIRYDCSVVDTGFRIKKQQMELLKKKKIMS